MPISIPAYSLVVPNIALECASTSLLPSLINTTTNPQFQPPNRPIVRNSYKRPITTTHSQHIEHPPPNPNEELKVEVEALKKEIVTLKLQLTDTVSDCENQKVRNNNLISSLQIENSGLVNSIESIKK